MKKVYRGQKEILKNIDKNKQIIGIVELDNDLVYSDNGGIILVEEACRDLIGDKYGYLLDDVSLKIVSNNILNGTVFLRVTASAKALLNEINKINTSISERQMC